MPEERELIIIGGGPGGLAAGIYTAIYNLDGKVVCEVLEQTRDKKIKILKYKKRKDYRRRIGHRQYITKLKVKSIQA